MPFGDIKNNPYVKKNNRRIAQHRRKVPVATKSYVQAQMNRKIETKTHLVESTATEETPYDTDHLLYNIVNVAQGDDYNERDGNIIHPMSLHVRYWVYNAQVANAALVRVMIGIWKPDSAVDTPNADDFLRSIDSESFQVKVGDPPVTSRKKLRMLYDRIHNLDDTNSLRSNTQQAVSVFLTGKRLPARLYYDELGNKNHVYLFAVSPYTSASGTAVNFFLSAKMKFKDI